MIAKEFILGGNAIFTVQPSAQFAQQYDCKPHYTYQVRYNPPKDKWPENFFVYLLSGPNNTDDYTYIGKLNKYKGELLLTQKSKFDANSWPVKIFNRSVFRLFNNQGDLIKNAGWNIYHNGHCSMCGKTLTVPESLVTGIGPVCRQKINKMHWRN